MAYQLREYQKKGKSELYKKIANGSKRIIYWAMTGSGKGLQMADIAMDALIKDKKVLVVMRRRELIFQTKENFKNYIGVSASIIMGNHKNSDEDDSDILITSIDTLTRRINNPKYDYLKTFDVIIVDEAHDTTSDGYLKLFDFLGDKIFVGFTATPHQVGRKTLSFWNDYVKPIEAHELRDQGHLCDIDIYAPKEQIDTRGIKKISGDFSQNELFTEAMKDNIVGDVVKNYKKLGKGLPAILFAVNIKHSRFMAKTFRESGIHALHRDQENSKEERDHAISMLKSGEIKVLCNVNLFSTGVDIPEACVCIMARPTESEILYVQQVGRVLRNPPGKPKAILIDHAGNCFRHGMPYDIRNIFIGGITKDNNESLRTITAKQCSQCFKILEPKFTACDSCGAELKKPVSDIKHIDGELVKINNTSSHIVSFSKMKQDLKFLDHLGKIKGWKPSAKYFKLHERYRDNIFRYEKELGIPKWLRGTITKNTKTY